MTTEETTVTCPWCNHVEALSDGIRDTWFTWASIKNEMVYLCWECTDKLHSTELAGEREKKKEDKKKA